MRILLTLTLSLALGCTFINEPNPPPDGGFSDVATDVPPDRPDTGDAEPDVPPDAEICDNGVDDDGDMRVDCADSDCEGRSCNAAGGCECRNGLPFETDCTDGEDNDGNGLADCEDYDCSSQEDVDCCGEDVTPPASWPDDDSTWPMSAGALEAEWESTSATSLLPIRDSDELIDFPGDDPFALVHFTCLSLALGAELEATFTAQGAAGHTCGAENGRCDSFASLVLSPVRDALPGRRLLDDLAVVVYPNGRVEVTQAGSPLPDRSVGTIEPTVEHRVAIELTPDIDERGNAVLRAEVSVSPAGRDPVLEWTGFPIELGQLIPDGACSELPGLYLAYEGHGDGVHVGDLVRAAPRACVNPSQFGGTLATLTADGVGPTASLDFVPAPPMSTEGTGIEWADEAISSPTLLELLGNWHVMVEATNDQPELEITAPIGYAIGHAWANGWPSDVWDRGDRIPRVGDQPPSCLDMSCGGTEPTQSIRDPYLFTRGGILFVAVASEIFEDGEPTERFRIHVGSANGSGAIDIGEPVLSPDQTSCSSVRDPVIVPRPGGTENVDYWLFYTCYQGTRAVSIDVVPVFDALGFELPEGAMPITVLAQEDVGAFGAGGIRSPSVVLDDTTYRVWFLGQSGVGSTAVGLALGGPKAPYPGSEMRRTTPDRPVLEPYRANPVLTTADRPFRECDDCTIEGLAATRVDEGLIRFLVARRVPLMTGRRYELVPFDQPWRR